MDVAWKQELRPICKIEDDCYDATSFNSNEAVNYLDLDSLKQSEQRETTSWNDTTDQEMTRWSNLQDENFHNYSSNCGRYPLQAADNLWNWSHNGAGDGYVPSTVELDVVSNDVQSYSDNSSYSVLPQSCVASCRDSNLPFPWQTENSTVNTQRNDIPIFRSVLADDYHKDVITTPNIQQQSGCSNTDYNDSFNKEFRNSTFYFESNMPSAIMNQTESGISVKCNRNMLASKEENILHYTEGKKGNGDGNVEDDNVVILSHEVNKHKEEYMPSCSRNEINKSSPLKLRISRSPQGILTLTHCDQKTASTYKLSSNDMKLIENNSFRKSPYKYIVQRSRDEGYPGSEFDLMGNTGKGIKQVINQSPCTHVKVTSKETSNSHCNTQKILLSNLLNVEDKSFIHNKDMNGHHLQDIKSVPKPKEAINMVKSTNDLKSSALRYSGIQRIQSCRQAVPNKCQNGSSYKCIKILSKDRVITQKEQQTLLTPMKYSALQNLEYDSKPLPFGNNARSVMQYTSHQVSPTSQRSDKRKMMNTHNFRRSLFQNVKIVSKEGHSIAHCEPTVLTPTKYIAKLKRETELKMFPMNGSTTASFVKKQKCSGKIGDEDEPRIMFKETYTVPSNEFKLQETTSATTVIPKEKFQEYKFQTKETDRYSIDDKTMPRILQCEGFLKNQGRSYHGNEVDTIPGFPEIPKGSDSQIITVTLMENNVVEVNNLLNKHSSSMLHHSKEDEIEKISGRKTPLRIIIKKRQEDKELLKSPIPALISHTASKRNQEQQINLDPLTETEKNSILHSNIVVQSEPTQEQEEIQRIKSFIGPRKKLMFRCYRCGQRQATRNSLITHIKSHQQPYCKLCFMIVSTIQQLQSHMIKGHPLKAELMYQHNLHFVTSKYGRRRPVLSTSSLKICRRKKGEMKTVFESKTILDKASTSKEINKTRKLERNKLHKILTYNSK